MAEDDGHHEPWECWRCGGRTEKRDGEHEPYWWCPRCFTAMVCACDRCLAWRALLWL